MPVRQKTAGLPFVLIVCEVPKRPAAGIKREYQYVETYPTKLMYVARKRINELSLSGARDTRIVIANATFKRSVAINDRTHDAAALKYSTEAGCHTLRRVQTDY